MKIIIILSIVILSFCGCKGTEPTNNNETGEAIFLILGQSNASSAAGYKEYEESEYIFVLDASSDWVIADPSLNKFNNIPVRDDMGYGYSFGYSFSLEYVKKYSRNIKIISNAKGGSNIDFQRGEGIIKTFERIEPYRKNIKAILYHQGEKDYKNDDWVKSAVKLVNEYRDFIGSDIPFIFGEICSDQNFERCVGFNQFNENIHQLHNYLDNIYIVSSNGITMIDQRPPEREVHFSKKGQIELGIRYFYGYDQLM